MPPAIALLTDFGLSGPYVGQIKAVLATLAPRSTVIDLGHDLEPFNIAQGAFFLAASAPWTPPGCICLSVVDPGVGGTRRIVMLEADGRTHIAPDNGLLSLVLDRAPACPAPAAWDVSGLVPSASATFHGRDIMAVLAGRMATGEDLRLACPPLDPASLVRLPDLRATAEPGRIRAQVLYADRFGNCILNIPVPDWPGLLAASGLAALALSGLALRQVRTYADLPPDTPGLLAGSQGYLELALGQNSAARLLNLQPGSPVLLTSLA